MSKKENIENFLETVKQETQKADVRFILGKGESILMPGTTDYFCNGFFLDKPDYILSIATGKPLEEWLYILVHEFSHFHQWQEKSPLWKENKYEKGDDGINPLHEWLKYRLELTEKEIKQFFQDARDVELDAEKRAVKTIKKFHLPIDIYWYKQQANAYIFTFSYEEKHRKSFEHAPYSEPKVTSQMPSRFLPVRCYSNIPRKYEKLFERYCLKK